jgi:hypothetical protein
MVLTCGMERISFAGCFGDIRLDRRGQQLHSRLFSNATRSIQAMSANRAEQKAFYRFLHNNKVSEAKIIKQLTAHCAQQTAGKVVLSIQDTTEINLTAHSGRLKEESGLGGIDDSKGTGFKLHPSFVVDALSCFLLGFSNIRIWHRKPGMGNTNERDYQQLPIEEKESYKWADSSNKSKDVLSEAKAIIIIQDREGDIFSQFMQVPDERTFLLVRSRINRNTDEGKLWDTLSATAMLGSYELALLADHHNNEPARTAVIEVRAQNVVVQCPKKDKSNKGKTVNAYIIEAREANETTANPVHWRLLTTWPVTCIDDALTVIEWYSWRWMIEDLFRVLKKGYLNIEASELESGWAIRKLSVLMLDTIVKLMQMHICYHCPEGEDLPTAMMFTPKEQECMNLILPRVAGKTAKLANPHDPERLKWAVWIIARLGGWKGYNSQRPPGIGTLFKGIEKFNILYDGWNL